MKMEYPSIYIIKPSFILKQTITMISMKQLEHSINQMLEILTLPAALRKQNSLD
ncbi:hypothetical protein CHCC15290_3807 [Bacillus licheniformis]|uniref:Uncharacterized protein n=1 Tax=Bacillus licheniformis TaxID=1402 RepID=A0A8B5YG65_BACLI|nr:hypothetical protein B4092_3831 [Bacillus licheniformis]TWN10748.1 hypothetical protein CHCC14564_3300 [Bacillus licheniformis LMG 17339]KYC84626.1 hypothetical protein B4091_3956 [Bacillus licheniformis]KYC98283.1 hypothetical protein B4164_3319 [Bacillus licheniformis]OLF91615.1 hypothetical protein B4089_2554 [Bacillus licheniformis]